MEKNNTMDRQKEIEDKINKVFNDYKDEDGLLTPYSMYIAIHNGDLLIPPKDKGEMHCWLLTNALMLNKEALHTLTISLVERDSMNEFATKEQVEREKLQAKIEVLKSAFDYFHESGEEVLTVKNIEAHIEVLEDQLKELTK